MADTADPLQWLTIDDFRTGVVSEVNFAYSQQAAPASTLAKGAAQVAGTYGCVALPGGGLGPLPGVVGTVDGPGGFTGTWHVNGMFVVPQINGQDEIVFGLEQFAGGNREFYLFSYQLWDTTLTAIKHYGPETNTTGDGVAPITGGMTRVNVATPANDGNPCLAMVYEWLGTATGPAAHNWLYPDPTAPTASFTPYEIASPQNGNGICFDNRILVLTIANYGWTSSGAALDTNEQINFTDPPNSAAMGSQDSVLVQENPFGYGCWGSISAGELLLIKHYGGAVMVNGDIASPSSVVRLTGVTSVGNILVLGSSTPQGFFYPAASQGLWLWNGSNTSNKVSQNLNDDFWTVPTPLGGVAGTVAVQGQYVFTSNNWVFDTLTGGWWRLTDITDATIPQYLWVAPSGDGMSVWCLPASSANVPGVLATRYGFGAPAEKFCWKSYPVLATKNRNVLVREVVVRAQGQGTVTVTIEGLAGAEDSPVPASFVVASSQPFLYRSTCGVPGQDLTVQVCSAGVPAGTPDSAPSPHDGVVTGAPTVVPSPWGGFGNAASFSGVPSTDGINCGPWNTTGVPAISGVEAAAAFTLEARIKAAGDSDPVCGWASADQPPQLWCNGTGGTWAFYATDNASNPIDVEAGVVDGLPHVLAADYDGTTVRLYLDGAMIASAPCTGIHAYTNGDNFRIGSDDNSNYIQAVIDEVRWSNVARYASNAGYTPASAPFTPDVHTLALYHLDLVSATAAPAPVIHSVSVGYVEQNPVNKDS